MTPNAHTSAQGQIRRRRTPLVTAGRPKALIARYGAVLAIVTTFAIFSVLSPDAFFTVLTMKAILRDCVPLLVVALGITVVLAMNDFDLSVGGLVSLCATLVAVLISTSYVGLNYVAAIVLTLAAGCALGLANGVLIAYLKMQSFILTIATGTIFAGVGLQIVNSQSVYTGIDPAFVKLGSGTLLGFSNQVYIGAAALIVVQLLLRSTHIGRYMYAIGGNAEAARLTGLRVRLLKAAGFGIVGLSAALGGILLTSLAGASNPGTGAGLLLPSYAAAFLGSSIYRIGLFTPIGTALGALYLQIVGTGLVILNISGDLVMIVQGGILAAAVLAARLVREDRA
jgi:ribose transport system permease protein